MRRLLLVCLLLLVVPSLVSAAFQTPTYQPLAVRAAVPAYTVKPDLSNIANLKQFGAFTQAQKGLLSKNGFFASPEKDSQLFFSYERNDYLVIPNFITADSVIQLYHIFYDYSLREVEAERLVPLCQKLTTHMLAQSVSTYRHLPPGPVRDSALRNVAYFGVAAKSLGLSAALPEEARPLVEREWERITAHRGREDSSVFPYQVDFSQFAVRGHYTRNEGLKRYFQAMMWYGLLPFALEWPVRQTAYPQIRQSLLITRDLYQSNLGGKPAIELWNRIYEPTVFYVETTDDHTPAEWRETAIKVWGHLPTPADLSDRAKLDAFHDLAMKLRPPRIATFPESAPQQVLGIPTGPQFRFMGQRSIPDSYMLQELVWSNVGTEEHKRLMPMGLDILAAVGSLRAYRHLTSMGETKYDHYDDQLGKLRDEFAAKSESDWRRNLYWGWLWVLKGSIQPVGKGYPSFMRSDAWLDRQLNSALASWSELRHDTILYAKQSVTAECGNGAEPGKQPPVPKGYVEPAAEVYHRLRWLTQTTRAGLRDRDLLTRALGDSFSRMDDLLAFLERVSVRELADQQLKAAEYDQIRLLGAELHNLFNQVSTAIGGKSGELISQSDDNMAVVADVHTDFTKSECLEEAVGQANHIYVVVPIGGKLYLTRGSIFSYYEFAHPMADRLTDEAWQSMLGTEKQLEPPSWTSSFLAGPKSEIPVPKWPRTDHSGQGSC